jgi:hypothetical protein
MEIFEQMRTIVGIIPDLEPSHLVSCHVVTRVVAHVVGGPLEVVDGWFAGKGYEHSWIDLGGNVIADLYPIGGACPFLVDTSGMMNPWRPLYVPNPKVVEDKSELSTIVERVLHEMKGVGVAPTMDERKTHAQ